MPIKRLYYLLALLALPVYGFGQTVPVAPSMLLDVGGVHANAAPTNLKFDTQGNFYVTGVYAQRGYPIDFDPLTAATGTVASNDNNFVAKYSAAGVLIWIKSFGGGTDTEINGFDIDRNGNVTLIGQKVTGSPPAFNDINEYRDAFVVHLDNSGNVLWEKLVKSGSKNIPIDPARLNIYQDIQTGYKVASDDAGNLIAVFSFGGSPDVDGKVTAKGSMDGLVVKYDTNGNIIWKFSLGAIEGYDNSALGALVDKDNNIIIAGYTNGTVNYNPLGTPVNVTAEKSMFLAKYSPAGILQWVKTINGSDDRYNIRLALDGQDNIYVNGAFIHPLDFGVTPTLLTDGYQDVFIAKYSSGGNLLYHKNIGGADATMLNGGLAVGPDNSLYLTGNFIGKVDVDPSSSVAELNSNGSISVFLAKYDDNGNYQWSFGLPGFDAVDGVLGLNYNGELPKIGAQYVNVNSSNDIFLTGGFNSTINFDGTGCGVSNLTPQTTVPGFDMFIVRYTPTAEKPVTNNTITAPAVTAICPGFNPDPIAGSTPVGGNYTYQWQLSLNNYTFTDITSETSKDYHPPAITATTFYRRRLIVSVCDAPNISNVITLTPAKPATVNTIIAPAINTFCNAGDAGLIRGSTPQAVGDVAYQWQQSTDNITFSDISDATAIDYDPPSIGVTTYYRRLITNTPCSIAIPGNTVTITVIPVPVPTVSAEQTVCLGEGVPLNASGGLRYSWSPATGLSSADVASPVAIPNATTTYSVTIYNGDCNATLQVKVNVVSRPTVDAGADKDVNSGDRVQLNAQVSDAEGANYSWTPATYLDNPTIANPVANPTGDITYRLTVTSAKGCFIVSDEIAINVHEKIIIPNSFTPNGDGINDLLTIVGLDSYKQSTLTIFDRYGQQIFKSQGYPKPWDGNRNGKPMPMGTYYYVIDLKNGQKRLSGYIALIK